ncbi:Fis family transcriptional regulator [Anoxybacterium hadale]|uniref:Fis family transcriptional regulator n=1 Tax=Anoxybacterium hadale TaxID=3408580 RepID=A0ACD1A676_9FIRM|nr:Fis family transcriptional regulator [Clostridiales bacterium]
MNYLDSFEVLSQCGLGAMLVTENNQILSVNEMGKNLLHCDENQLGANTLEAVTLLCEETDEIRYANIAFGEYLCRCATLNLPGQPPRTKIIVFRVATNDACHDMLISILNGISESVTLFDAAGRLYLLNDSAVNMDSLVTSDVLGQHVTEVYRMQDGQFHAIPQVIQEKRAKVNLRQYYTTCFGKNVDIVANVFPIVQNSQTLGAFSVMQDWSTTSELHKQIIDLQGKLLEQSTVTGAKEKSALTAKYQFRDIIHISPAMNRVVARSQQIACSDSSVMIYGETGTGKELLAQSIHNGSRRANGPFLAINCTAIPDNLLEGLLFGTERGAYTGAESRAGLFEQANGGTLLLDEINSMNILLQAKLLRVLQDGMIRRVGGVKEVHVDVRVLSNTNCPPYQAIEENKLRRDLFYRLGVININIPPLRDHKEDIPLLVKSFIQHFNKKLLKNVRNIDHATSELFNSYHWPGNIRELDHAIEHAMNLIPNDQSIITPDYIPEHILYLAAEFVFEGRETKGDLINLRGAKQNTERHELCKALLENGGNISKTARFFGISRQNLQYKMKRNGIDVQLLLDKR